MGYRDAITHAVFGVRECPPPTSAKDIVTILENWAPRGGVQASVFLDLSKRTLDEVTRLTGYEDEKANRILTAMAFLSALAGVLFGTFLTKYQSIGTSSYLLVTVYLVFYLYILCLALGAICVVYAVKPRFNVPTDWGKETGKPSSFLFFRQIILLEPAAWAKAFSSRTSFELQTEYIRNSIFESYLIAEKVRNKLAYLEPGMSLLWTSTRILLVWIFVYGIAMIFGPGSPKNEIIALPVKTIEARLSTTENSIQNVDERLGRLEEGILELENSVEHLAKQIESLQSRSASPRAGDNR
jgi:hypothetical protein